MKGNTIVPSLHMDISIFQTAHVHNLESAHHVHGQEDTKPCEGLPLLDRLCVIIRETLLIFVQVHRKTQRYAILIDIHL